VIVAVGTLKGGTGKSTLSRHIAGAWGLQLRQVVLLDCDFQRSNSRVWSGFREEPLPFALAEIDSDKPDKVLLRQLDHAARDHEDAVLDLPPHERSALRVAASVADLLVIPVGASTEDLAGSDAALELVGEVRADRGDGGPGVLLAPCRIPARTRIERDLLAALKDTGEAVAPPIHHRVAWAESGLRGLLVFERASWKAAAGEFADFMTSLQRQIRKGR